MLRLVHVMPVQLQSGGEQSDSLRAGQSVSAKMVTLRSRQSTHPLTHSPTPVHACTRMPARMHTCTHVHNGTLCSRDSVLLPLHETTSSTAFYPLVQYYACANCGVHTYVKRQSVSRHGWAGMCAGHHVEGRRPCSMDTCIDTCLQGRRLANHQAC